MTKITTKIVKPNAKAMFRSAVVLLRKHEPGTTAGQECTERETTWSQRKGCITMMLACAPLVKDVLLPEPEDAATSDV